MEYSFYKATSLYKELLILDDDYAGRNAIKEIEKTSLFDVAKTIKISCNYNGEAELEDILKEEFTHDILLEYGFNNKIKVNRFEGKKWSERMENIFKMRGLTWNNQIENEIKIKIVNKIIKQKEIDFITEQGNHIIEQIIDVIENMLEKQ